MPVSNAELRILMSLQSRGEDVAARIVQSLQALKAAADEIGQSTGFDQAQRSMTQMGAAMQKTVQQASGLTKAMGDLAKQAPWERMAQGAQQAVAATGQVVSAYQKVGAAATAAGRQAAQATSQLAKGGAGPTIGANVASGATAALAQVRTAFQGAQQVATTAAGAIGQALMAIGNAARGAAGGVAGMVTGTVNGLRSLVGGLTGAAGAVASFGRSMLGLQGTAAGITSTSTALGGLARSAQGLTGATSAVTGFGAALRSFAGFATAVVGVTSAITLLQAGFRTVSDAAIGFNSQLELAKIAFTSLMGSGEKATAFMAQLRDMAESTAFEFPELLKASQQLIGVGLAAENVLPLMKDIAGAMTAAGRTSADLGGVSRALQQIFTTGRVQADEMNQLAERGIPAWRILGEAIQANGESIEAAIGRARQLSEQGKISAADFFNAFQQYSKIHGWRELAENAVLTFSGAVSNLKDSFRFLVADATEPMFASISAGFQNLSTLLQSAPVRQFAVDVAATMRDVIASFAPVGAAFGRVFGALKTEGIGGALHQIVAEFQGLTGDIAQAGSDLMAAYANGIIQGASDLIQGAVDFVADLIASYLIGNSPPPQGPLAGIEQGGEAVAAAWLAGLANGFQEVDAVVVKISDAFGNIGKSLSLGQAESLFEGAKGNLAGLTAAADVAEGALRSLNDAQRELDREQGGLTGQVEAIKSAYGDQIEDLERSIDIIKEQNTYAERYADLLQKQNDAITEQADLRDKAALNELKAAEIAAEGDPVKKAALTKDLAINKARQEGLNLAQRAQDLDRQARQATEKQSDYEEKLAKYEKDKAAAKKEGKKFETKPPEPPDPKDLAIARQRIDADREELKIKQAIYDQTDHAAIAQIDASKAAIQSAADLRHADEERKKAGTAAIKNAAEIERIEKDIAALPLEEQVAALKKEQADALRPLEKRLDVLKQEERQLQAIRKEWQALKTDIDAAIGDQKGADKAAKSAGGTPSVFPGGGKLNLDRLEIDAKAGAARVGKSMAEGMAQGFQDHFGQILGGVLGGALGGAAFGPLGLIAGAAFGAQVGAGVQQRVPQLSTIFADMGRTFLQAFAGDWSTDHGDAWVSPIVDAAGRIGIVVRKMSDTIAGAWEALKGPVATATAWIKEHFGIIVAALTGLLIPAFSLLLTTVGAIVGPIIALLAPLTPAILAVSAAAVLLKLAWDTNFGGIRDTVATAMPQILEAFGRLKEAWDLLAKGDTAGAFSVLLSALGGIGQAIAPILAGIGQAIGEQAATWGAYLWEWVVAATPDAIAAIGDFANAVVDFVKQNGEPFLRALLGWGKGFAAWIAPMIGPALVGLGTLVDGILTWIGAQIPVLAQAIAKWATIFLVWIATDVVPQIPGALVVLGGAIVLGIAALIPRVLQGMVDLAVAIGTGFMEGLATAAPNLHQALLDMWTTMTDVWTTITTTVQGVIDTIVGIWQGLPALLQGVWDQITALFQSGVDLVVNVWNAGWALVQSAWDAAGAAILAAIMAVWDSLDADTRAALTEMATAIGALWEALVALATAVWNRIMQAIQTVLEAIATFVATWIDVATTSWQAFMTTLETLWTFLATTATTTWQAIVDAITAVVTPWWETAQAWWETVKTTILGVWTALSTTVGAEVKKFTDAIVTQIDAWWAWAQQKLTDWTKLGTDWANALMDALLAGINAKIQAISGAVTGLANQLTDIINKALGRGTGGAGGPAGSGIDVNGTLQQQAVQAANKYGLPPAKFLSQIQQESGFDPNALNKTSGARGIAQFMPGTGNAVAGRMGVDPAKFWSDVSLQIEGAAFHMKELNDQFGDYDKALAGYNAGAGAVKDAGGVPNFPETLRYIRDINARAQTITIPAAANAAMGMNGRLPVVAGAAAQSYWTSGGTHGGHPAADIFAAKGTPITAPVGGISTPARYELGGEATIIKGDDGKFYYMAHGNVPFRGGRVEAGQPIGQVGQTGNAAGTAPHLHYAIASDPGLFNRFNGSGDITGTSADWTTGGADLPMMAPGAGGMGAVVGQAKELNAQLTLVDQNLKATGTAFVAVQQTGTTAMDATTTSVTATGQTIERTAAVASTDATMVVSATTDALGTVTRVYSDASGVIGASMTNASGQVTQAWGIIATAQQNGAATAEAANQQVLAFSASLTTGMVPAGAEAGNQIQRMTDDINPLLAEIAAGTLTTDQLVMKLGALSLNAGLTSEPLTGMADKTMGAQEAMLLMLAEAAKVDPQFAILRDQLVGTGADAQTMAVTFAEGVANSVGVAGAAVEQMASGVDPLIAAVDAGTVSGTQLEEIIVRMADAAGLATAPFRQMTDGMIDSNQALEDVIKLSAGVGPEFAALAEEIEAAGTVSQASAKKYLELVKAFKAGARPADAAAEAATGVATEVEGAVEPVAQLATTLGEQATVAAEQFNTSLTTGMQAAIENVRALAPDAESAGNEVGTALVRGLQSGIEGAAQAVAEKAAAVVRGAIDAAKAEADAHSPSNETKEIGFNMNAGLEVGQIEDSKYVEEAARGVIGAALTAMRDEADAHSPSGEGVRIGKDILKGLEKGLRSGKTSDVAREQIKEYLAVAKNFSDAFATQIDIGVAKLQHQIASAQNENLAATLAVKDAQEAVEKAARGTYEQQMQIATLQYLQAETQQRIALAAEDDLNTEIKLREALAAQDAVRAGSLDQQREMIRINRAILDIGVQAAQLDMRSAQAAQDRLAVDQQLAATEDARSKAAKGTLEVQLREADIGQRTAAIALETAKAEQQMLPLKQRSAALQREIEKATKGTVVQQQAAIRAEAEQAAKRIELLQIQDKLALAETTGGGMTQDEINALHAREAALQTEAESNGRQLEIEKLRATIATAGAREQQVALADQIAQREEALVPIQDEKATLDAEQQVIAANLALAAAGYDHQVVTLQDQVASHDAIATQLEVERAVLDAQQAILEAQQGIITATNEARAAAMDEEILGLQAAQDAVETRQQHEQDILDRLQAQQGVIEATTALEATRHAGNLIRAQEQLEIQEAQQHVLERQLEIQQGIASVISTQVALANALKEALTAAGIIKEKTAESSSSKGSSKSKSSSSKKKKAWGGPISADDVVLVGEHGPEVIVPSADGYVLNNATTERLLGVMTPRLAGTVAERRTGGTVWRDRPYLVGEGGVEGLAAWGPSGGAPGGGHGAPLKVVNATVHYHVHEQQVSGEARVERVVYETLMVALNT